MHLLRERIKGKHVALKRTAEDRKVWQKLIRAGSHTPLLLSRLLEEEDLHGKQKYKNSSRKVTIIMAKEFDKLAYL